MTMQRSLKVICKNSTTVLHIFVLKLRNVLKLHNKFIFVYQKVTNNVFIDKTMVINVYQFNLISMELESKENPRNLWKKYNGDKYQVKPIHHSIINN